MRRVALFFIFTLSLIASIEWQTDFDQAFAKAKEQNRPLFIFIERHDPPCRWCQLMQRTTLADAKIASYINEHFIPLKLIREHNDYPRQLYPRYVPTIYVITPDKRIIKKIVGYWPKEEFQSDLLDIERALRASKSNN